MTTLHEQDKFYKELGNILAKYHSLYQLNDIQQGNGQGYTDQAAQNFARYLRAARRNARLSETELAVKAKPNDVDLSAFEAELFALERGLIPSAEIQLRTLSALAEALDEDVQDFASLLERELPKAKTSTLRTQFHDGYKAATAYFGSTKKLLFVFVVMVMAFAISITTVYTYLSLYAVAASEKENNDGSFIAFADESDNSVPPQSRGFAFVSFTKTVSSFASNASSWLHTSGVSLSSYFQAQISSIERANQILALSMLVLLFLLIIWIAILRGDIPLILAPYSQKWQRRLIYITPLVALCIAVIAGYTNIRIIELAELNKSQAQIYLPENRHSEAFFGGMLYESFEAGVNVTDRLMITYTLEMDDLNQVDQPAIIVAVNINKLPSLKWRTNQLASLLLQNFNETKTGTAYDINIKYDTVFYPPQNRILLPLDVQSEISDFASQSATQLDSALGVHNATITMDKLVDAGNRGPITLYGSPWFDHSKSVEWKFFNGSGIGQYTDFQGTTKINVFTDLSWQLWYTHTMVADNLYPHTLIQPSIRGIAWDYTNGINWIPSNSLSVGAYNLTVTVDPDNRFTENDETSNKIIQTYQIGFGSPYPVIATTLNSKQWITSSPIVLDALQNSSADKTRSGRTYLLREGAVRVIDLGAPVRPFRIINGDTIKAISYNSSSTIEKKFIRVGAQGDYDGDGDLDLATGNGNLFSSYPISQPVQLYRNDNGLFRLDWKLKEIDSTRDIAWGDYDGDGDLDLAVGNEGQNRLYRNDNGKLLPEAVWSFNENDSTLSVAWGDYDGDGNLDLAVGNGDITLDNGIFKIAGQPSRVYRNNGLKGDGRPDFQLVWSSTEKAGTTSIAWGDYDSDGDLDLLAGTEILPSKPNGGDPAPTYRKPEYRLYKNDGGVLTTKVVWKSDIPTWPLPENENGIASVALGDMDGSGHLELILLHVQPAQEGLWSVVQWQDTSGNWHDVESWRGTVVNGKTIWGGEEKDLGKGPFRWVVVDGDGFALVKRDGQLNYRATAPSAVRVTIHNQDQLTVTADFWVDLYIDPSPISTAINRMMSVLFYPGLVPPSSRMVYVQVDSANDDTTYGGALETHEGVYYVLTKAEHNIEKPYRHCIWIIFCGSKETLWTYILFAISGSVLMACLFSIIGRVVVREGKMQLMLTRARQHTTIAKGRK